MKNETVIKARYAETDQMGIIHHSIYPIWFEEGRTNFIKELGFSYSRLENNGLMLPLASLECSYMLPVRYEDEVIIETSVIEMRYASIKFSYKAIIKNSGELAAKGSTTHAFVNSNTFRPLNLKKVNYEMYKKLCDAKITV